MLRLHFIRIRSARLRVRRKIKASNMICPLHESMLSIRNSGKELRSKITLLKRKGSEHTQTPVECKFPVTYVAQKAHCSPVKYE